MSDEIEGLIRAYPRDGTALRRMAADLIASRAQLSEAQARLAEIERQEPVAVFKGAHDGRFVIDFLHGYIPPVSLALYAAPVPQAAVKGSLTTGEREAAEETYTRRAFEYEQNPIGSRDWTLFWSGWCARAAQSAQPVSDAYKSSEQAVADDVVRDALIHCAALAHIGGMKEDALDILCAIRKITLPWFDGSGTQRQCEQRVIRAMIFAAQQQKAGGA